MSGKTVLDRYVAKNPLAVMTRAIAVAMLDERLDAVFECQRSRQYDSTIKFSTLARSMAEIALGTLKNRNQAYRVYQQELQASSVAYYGKLNRTEPAVSEGVVAYSAEQAASLLNALGFSAWEVLPGYRCLALDGNHLRQTEKRLKATRGLCAAPLPGTIVARFNLHTQIFDHAYLLEDAHAQESTVLDRVLDDIEARDLILADRHFCIQAFLQRLAARGGFFLIRQHGRLQGKRVGKRRCLGRTETGQVYEQRLVVGTGESALEVRRITVCLDQPTRDGDREIHLLSNVPEPDADGRRLAEIYRQRWEIENAFHVLTMTLNCEAKSNCQPRCALFQFCLAMVAYNCRQVLLAALYAEHPQEDVERMSPYHVAIDIVRPLDGMLTAVNDREWKQLVPRATPDVAAFLRRVSRHVDVKSYRKSVRGPKKPPPTRQRCKPGTHVSTAKLLKSRNPRC